MKIAFIARSTLFKQPGGDTQQISESAAELQLLGVDVDIILSGSRLNYQEYDLLHFFNLGRPADLLRYSRWHSKPLFISTIWVDYGKKSNEKLKAIARGLIGNDKFPPLSYLSQPHEKSVETLAENADLLITTTEREIPRLTEKFNNLPPIEVVYPGLNRDYLENLPNEKEERHGVLCVGRFEEIKNQLAVIEALRDTDIQVTFVGDPATNNPSYYNKCKAAATANMAFRPHASMTALQILYRTHKVVVVPSLFETFGLTALEGLSQGCNVVLSTETGAFDVLKDHTTAIDPTSNDSIVSGISAALKSEQKPESINFAKTFTWQQSAQILKKLYETRLSV